MPIVRQADFTGGEIDPYMYGKTTHAKYPSAVRQLLNFVVGPQGAAKNRPGTRYFATWPDPANPPRLIPFSWPSKSYVLAFGNLVCRLYPSGNVGVDLVTPFTAAMLPFLKYSQKDDTLTVCYGGELEGTAAVAPQEIRRVSDGVWTIGAATFAPVAAVVNNIYLSDANGALTGSVGPVPDDAHPAQPWNWAFTLDVRNLTTGEVSETSIVEKTSDTAIFSDAPSTVPLVVAYDPATTYPHGHIVVSGGELWTSMQDGNVGQALTDPA